MPKRKTYNGKKKTSARRKLFRRAKRSTYRKRAPTLAKRRPPFFLYNSLVQPKLRTKLVYCDTIELAPDNGMDNHLFRINSIFDPDYTGTGHQPAFHDQWSPLYSNYRVTGFKYSVKFTQTRLAVDITDYKNTHTGTTDTYPFVIDEPNRDRHILFIEANNNTTMNFTESTDLNMLRETGGKMAGVKWRYGPMDPTKSIRISGYVNLKNLFVDVDNFDDATAFGSDPTNVLYLAVGAMSTDGKDTNAVKADVRLTYFIEMSGVKDVDAS